MSDVGEDVQEIWPDCWGREMTRPRWKTSGKILKN